MGTETSRFTFSGRIRSVGFALRGIRLMLVTQHNAWIHAVATAAVCGAGALLKISRGDWCWIVAAMIAVWTAEALNTSLELLCDVASPELHPLIAKAKDVAAGAVLLSAVGAAIIGVLVLGPPILIALRSG